MQDELRRKHIAELIASLDVLSGPNFERFCYRFIEGYAPHNWDHRGTNVAGAPVPHIVDSVADGGHAVAQYSSEDGYFSGDLVKINSDLRMARTNHSNVNELYLVSTRKCGQTAKTKVEQLEARMLGAGLALEVLDAQKVAEHIIDNLHSDVWIKKLAEFVPVLAKWQAEWALTNAIPKYTNYVARPVEESEIKTRLHRRRLIRVRGFSGMGKSALCSAVAIAVTERFYSVLWVQASTINRIEQLSELKVENSGSSVNLLGLLKDRPCLLVLDDLRVDLSGEQLLAGAHAESRVLVTSQHGRSDSYALTTLDEGLARKVLEINAGNVCADEVWRQVWGAVGGYPLLLELLGCLVRSGDWSEVTDLCPEALQLDDTQYQKVCERILERHRTALHRELAFLRWVDTNVIDPLVLRAGAGRNAARHLEVRGLLVPSKDALLRVHDLVYESIKAVIELPTSSVEAEFIGGLDRLLIAVSDNSDLLRERAARLHRPLIRQLIETKKAPAGIRYAYALVDKHAAEFSLLRNVEELRSAVLSATDVRAMPEIYAAIEEMEVHYVLKRSKHLETFAPVFEALENRAAAIPDAARFIKHHLGKFYLWLKNYPEAAALFDELLRTDPDFAEARLQRANVHVGTKEVELAVNECKTILDQQRDRHSVTVTVVLAVFQLLGRHAKPQVPAYANDYRDELREALQAGVATGHPQALDALAVLAKALSYKSSEILVAILSDVADWPAKTNRELFASAQILKELGKAKQKGDPDGASKHLQDAADLYSRTSATRDFESHQTAEGFILVNRAEDALRMLDGSTKDADKADYSPFWFYRRSQAQRMLGQHDAARASIERGISLLSASDPTRAAFLDQRFQVRHALNESGAIEDLRAAIDAAVGDYKATLQQRIDLLK